MEHELYSVFKHPAPWRGLKWAVQFPHGLWACKTKREATRVANTCLHHENDAAVKTAIHEADAKGHTVISQL